MVLDVDDAIEVYREYASFPNVTSARLCNGATPGHVRVLSHWSQRDLERKEKVSFSRAHIVQLDLSFGTPPQEANNEQWNVESSSGKYRAIIRKIKGKKGEDQQYIEIWTEKSKVHCILVSSLEQHGKIYENDGHFGSLQWSYSETHLLYVAEGKEPSAKSFFDRKAAADIESGKTDITRGEEFLYSEDWGEQMVGKRRPVVCVLDVEAGVVSTLDNVPDHINPGQPIWCPGDEGVICVGWYHQPYRLGLIYCPIRKSALFYIDLKNYKCTILGASDGAVRSPRFSPDHSKLIYLENDVGGPHFQCARLKMCDWATKGIVEVVESVSQPQGADTFPGIYTLNLNLRCWANDNKRLLMSTRWRSKQELVLIHSETGDVTKLTSSEPDIGSWSLMDISNDIVVAACSSPNRPGFLVIGQLPTAGSEYDMKWVKMDADTVILPEISWVTFPVEVPQDRVNPKFPGLDYECILLRPKGVEEKIPLVVYNHGGPHSAFGTEFMIYFSGLVRCGYAVLLVNYRGSVGFGQDSVDSLPGNIGTQDVQDVQSAVEMVVEKDSIDNDRVVVIGGSHGGFLTTHLIGQYPNFYKAAVARNPVINLCFMASCTDIPDWCFTEIGEKFEYGKVPNADTYRKMYEKSPISHVDKMVTPLLLMVGEDDRRVPLHQSHELRCALTARGTTVRLNSYPGNAHPIDKVDAEADAFINIIQWFNTHISKKK